MSDEGTDPRPGGSGFETDRALSRLEDVLLEQPFDRALPDLEVLLDRAGVLPELLRRDDRALKVLHEAIVARPYGQLDEVRRTRAEVELLTLEVEVLRDRIVERADDPDAVATALARLEEVGERLGEVRDRL